MILAAILLAGAQLPAPVVEARPSAATDPNKAPESLVVPALTAVKVEMLANVGSATSKSLDTFPIRLAEPIVVGGVIAVPAGTMGQGEVVHAKPSGGSGTGGELVLAARWLDVGGKQLRLRSMHISVSGQSAVGSVNAINMASSAVVPGVGLIGFMIKGRNVAYASGTIAEAKTAQDFAIELTPAKAKSGI